MAENKKKKGLDLTQTRGSYKLSGIVTGMDSERAFTEKPTKTDRTWRKVAFGVKTNENSTVFTELTGMEKDEVIFSKKGEDGKYITKRVSWKDRFDFNEEGYKLMGINVGVTKKMNEKGDMVNDKKVVTDFDACKIVSDELKDNVSVFTRGKIEFGSYTDDKGNTHCSTKFVPSQISLCRDVDFNAEGYKETSMFTQAIVFMGITVDNDKKRGVVSAKIVNFDNIEDVEMYITDLSLVNMFKKNLNPYTYIEVWGNIAVSKDTEEVKTEDCWGAKNEMEKTKSPTVRELIITGAEPTSIDTKTYTEDELDKALARAKAEKQAKDDFGSTNSWGSSNLSTSDDDDDIGW